MELRLDATVTGVDPTAHEVTLADGSRSGDVGGRVRSSWAQGLVGRLCTDAW